MKLFDHRFRERAFRLINHQVYTAEMIHSLQNIIHIQRAIRSIDRVCFKDVPGLLVGQSASLNMVGVVGEVNLRAVVDAAFQPALLLLPQTRK